MWEWRYWLPTDVQEIFAAEKKEEKAVGMAVLATYRCAGNIYCRKERGESCGNGGTGYLQMYGKYLLQKRKRRKLWEWRYWLPTDVQEIFAAERKEEKAVGEAVPMKVVMA